MIRKIIHIGEEKCNGCGLCATACHEGAIDIINGKAKLVRENFCDGFGDCLPGCPTGAITFEEREAPAYDEAAVQENKKKKELQEKMKHLHEGGCPGSRMRMLEQSEAAESAAAAPVQSVSRLRNWPVQIKLAPVHAPYFEGAKLLIAADCTAYAYANFHQEFMRGKVTLIGCPKLDAVDYSEKLTEILRRRETGCTGAAAALSAVSDCSSIRIREPGQPPSWRCFIFSCNSFFFLFSCTAASS